MVQGHVKALINGNHSFVLEAGEDDCGFNILSGLGLSLREVVGKLLELTNLVLDVLLLLGLGEIVSLLLHLRSAPASATSEKIERLR